MRFKSLKSEEALDGRKRPVLAKRERETDVTSRQLLQPQLLFNGSSRLPKRTHPSSSKSASTKAKMNSPKIVSSTLIKPFHVLEWGFFWPWYMYSYTVLGTCTFGQVLRGQVYVGKVKFDGFFVSISVGARIFSVMLRCGVGVVQHLKCNQL